MLKWKLVDLEIVLILTQDRCMVRAEHTIGYEIVLDVPDGSPRSQGSSGSSFSVRLEIVLILMKERCTDCTEHTIGSEIILDAPDGTSR